MKNTQLPTIRYSDIVCTGLDTFSVIQFNPDLLQYKDNILSLTLSYRERGSFFQLTKGMCKGNVLLYNGTDYFLAFRNGFRIDYLKQLDGGGAVYYWREAIIATSELPLF